MTTPVIAPAKVKPPYKPPITAPLTAARRAAVIAYLLKTDVYNRATLEATKDKDLVGEYNQIATGGKKIGGPAGGIIGKIGQEGAGIAGGAADAITSVTDFLEKLAVVFTAEFWLRVGEFLLGAILVGVGISHLSTDAGNAVKSIPGYGKLVGKVLPK